MVEIRAFAHEASEAERAEGSERVDERIKEVGEKEEFEGERVEFEGERRKVEGERVKFEGERVKFEGEREETVEEERRERNALHTGDFGKMVFL